MLTSIGNIYLFTSPMWMALCNVCCTLNIDPNPTSRSLLPASPQSPPPAVWDDPRARPWTSGTPRHAAFPQTDGRSCLISFFTTRNKRNLTLFFVRPGNIEYKFLQVTLLYSLLTALLTNLTEKLRMFRDLQFKTEGICTLTDSVSLLHSPLPSLPPSNKKTMGGLDGVERVPQQKQTVLKVCFHLLFQYFVPAKNLGKLGQDVAEMTIKSISKHKGTNYTYNHFLGQTVQIIQTRTLWMWISIRSHPPPSGQLRGHHWMLQCFLWTTFSPKTIIGHKPARQKNTDQR